MGTVENVQATSNSCFSCSYPKCTSEEKVYLHFKCGTIPVRVKLLLSDF